MISIPVNFHVVRKLFSELTKAVRFFLVLETVDHA
jgi:hypothetical protein